MGFRYSEEGPRRRNVEGDRSDLWRPLLAALPPRLSRQTSSSSDATSLRSNTVAARTRQWPAIAFKPSVADAVDGLVRSRGDVTNWFNNGRSAPLRTANSKVRPPAAAGSRQNTRPESRGRHFPVKASPVPPQDMVHGRDRVAVLRPGRRPRRHLDDGTPDAPDVGLAPRVLGSCAWRLLEPSRAACLRCRMRVLPGPPASS